MCKSKHRFAISDQLLFCNVNQSFLINRTSYIDKEVKRKSNYNNIKVNCVYNLLKKARISFKNKLNY